MHGKSLELVDVWVLALVIPPFKMSEGPFDLLVAADGLRSSVRQSSVAGTSWC